MLAVFDARRIVIVDGDMLSSITSASMETIAITYIGMRNSISGYQERLTQSLRSLHCLEQHL